ncbi:MAG: hypothetical protein LBI29_02625 [Rickettsiales bacterium]|jgi:predicted RNA-binding Zn-ribbon protein involved in translation (DUF1610 family)|nr:hypothetical protein [Rickettsiales bacterium]
MDRKNKPYFFTEGLKEVSRFLGGDENIYLGIRPYGFHAGNQIVFNVYPDLLCEFLRKRGIEPKFNFFIFINDWEQVKFAQSDNSIKNYPFNVSPQDTIFQFAIHDKTIATLVDHWESVILENFYENVKNKYPQVSIFPVRNSSMRSSKWMKKVVLKTIEEPGLVADVLRRYSGKNVEEGAEYCRAVCPMCRTALVKNSLMGTDDVAIQCQNCGFNGIRNYSTLYFWLYHKPLAIPRIKEYRIDLCITGADHHNEGDFLVRKNLFRAYNISVKMPKTLYTPVLYGKNELPMGKSKNNTVNVEYNLLRKMVSETNSKIVRIGNLYGG